MHQTHTRRFRDCQSKSREGRLTDFPVTQRTLRPTAGHAAQNRSESWNGTLLLLDEMSKGSKCKRVQQCKHKVPHNQSVSTCSDRAISSGHAGHYLTVFWCSEGNLREARAWLGWFRGRKEQEQRGIFLYLTSERKQWNSLQTYRCLQVFFAQNKEGCLDRKRFTLAYKKVQPENLRALNSCPRILFKWALRTPAASRSSVTFTELTLWQTY